MIKLKAVKNLMKFRIKNLRIKYGLKQKDLAEQTGLSNAYLSALETGYKAKSPSSDVLEKIAEAIGVRVGELFDEEYYIPVIGYVSSDGIIESDKNDGSHFMGMYRVNAPLALPPDHYAALEIKGMTMSPTYHAGDIVFFDRERINVQKDCLNRVCICEDRQNVVRMKNIKIGTAPGLYHLSTTTPTGTNLHDIDLVWASPVRIILPYDLVRKEGDE